MFYFIYVYLFRFDGHLTSKPAEMTPPAGLTVILIVGVTAVALAAYEYFFASPRRENFNRYDRSSNYIPESLYAPQIQSKEDADR